MKNDVIQKAPDENEHPHLKTGHNGELHFVIPPGEWSHVSILEIVNRFGHGIRTLDLSYCSQTDDFLIKEIALCLPNLRKLSLTGCIQLTDSSIIEVARCCKKLTELYLNNCDMITDYSINEIGENCSKLVQVDLTGCPDVTGVSVRVLTANNPSLLYLTPGFLRSIPQAEEIDSGLEIRDQLSQRLPFRLP